MKFKSLLVVLVAWMVCLPLLGNGEDLAVTRQKDEQGNAEAQASLRKAYDNGEGVPQDDKEAVKWYRLAAEQGQIGEYNQRASSVAARPAQALKGTKQ